LEQLEMTNSKNAEAFPGLKPVGGQEAGPARVDGLLAKTHAQLKNDIIAGLHRPGEKLRIEQLKRDYGVSSGTLREALAMLIADGMIVSEKQRVFKVKPVSAEDLADLSRIRILLEKEALRQSIAHGDDEWVAKVVSSFYFLSRTTDSLTKNMPDQALFDEWERRHRDFHLSLISATPSEWTRYFLNIAYPQNERYRRMFHVLAQGHARSRHGDVEHEEIFEAVLARDAQTAASLLERHLLRTLDEWVEFFEKTGAFSADRPVRGDTPRAKPVARRSRRHR
jgi:DNA-binding GntR family transcriptional regulator